MMHLKNHTVPGASILMFLLHALLLSSPCMADPDILMINSYHKGYPWTDDLVKTTVGFMKTRFSDCEIHVEYMDTKRIKTPRYLRLFQKIIEEKYHGHKPDIVIVSDDNAFRFILTCHKRLFPGTPVLFLGVNHFDPAMIDGHPEVTGIVQNVYIADTVRIALKLTPGFRRVAVIYDDTLTGRGYREQVFEARKGFEGLEFTLLDGAQLTTEEMLDRVEALPSDSISLLCIWVRDKTGIYVPWDKTYPELTRRSPVPVYGVLDRMLDFGVVGGMVQSAHYHALEAAGIAEKILKGVSPADIPVHLKSRNVPMFDYKAMERWNIDEKRLPGPDLGRLWEIEKAAKKAGELTRQLLTFSRRVESRLRPVDLNREVLEVQKLLERTIPKMIDIELHLQEGLKVINADPAQMEQVMLNLAVNARDAMPEGGKLVIETENVVLDEAYCKTHLGAVKGEYVLLCLSDTGHGMDKETLAHIFEPFYTTKETGKGTGLGLAMVYGIVKSHGGYIMCYSEPGEGTTFKIYFPAVESQGVAHRPRREEETAFPGGNETILLVDDEDTLRDLGKEMLERFGYTVLQAENGESALRVYERNQREISLVILDLIMPGMGGRKCLEELMRINPQVNVVVASGYSANRIAKVEKQRKRVPGGSSQSPTTWAGCSGPSGRPWIRGVISGGTSSKNEERGGGKGVDGAGHGRGSMENQEKASTGSLQWARAPALQSFFHERPYPSFVFPRHPSTENDIRQPDGDLGENHDQGQPRALYNGERNDGSVDVCHADGGRNNSFHIKEIEAERRRHITDFHVDGKEDAEPDRVKAVSLYHGEENGHADHHDTRRVQDHGQEKDDDLDKDDGPPGSAGDVFHDVFDQMGCSHAVIRGTEAIGPEKNPHDHAREAEGSHGRFHDEAPTHLPVDKSGYERSQDAHSGRFGWGGDSAYDGTQDHEHDDDG